MAVTDEAINKIKGMIISGELAPGERLPPEKELSDRLGLSRNSLREAVKALEVIRVLDVRRGDGTYVTSLEPRLLLEAMTFVVDLHDDASVLDIFAVRRILESAAAGIAARSIETDDIRRLRESIAAVDSDSSVENLVQHDLEFHKIVVDAADNAYLSSLIDGLSSHTIRARVWRGLTQENVVERTLDEHRSITDALAAGDVQLAQALTTVHISGVEDWLRKAL
jgi:GntR family transcriptional repressor for pyruvate dehydrogenase complex